MFTQLSAPQLMGILNVTPDSFSDGGRYSGVDAALCRVQAMLDEGMDIVDVGGESTRPGADPVSHDEQIRRVVPVIAAIRSVYPALPISIDTMSACVAQAALQAGATLVNDVSGGVVDPQILALAADRNVPIVLMHMQGLPKTMQLDPYYDDVVAEVTDGLQGRIDAALAAGIAERNIAIDPGIGFGKRKQDNIDLLANLQRIAALGFPVLLGTSRKRFMGSICNVSEPSELVTATAVTTALGVMAGVRLFRVHDILPNRQAADLAWAIKQAQ
ncbi:dihydropteroate synthase [Methylomonas rhizoryzae]|uniref:dihydropteroate synthase n=1 Tax=Methylomonas rhizoryzae TaxID=2608981 RepID=UPI0012327885|nr:dihydropteroate synthase [Methylomonas rhizoryzae]